MDGYYFLVFGIWVTLGAIGAVMNEKRNRNKIWGFVIGFLFGVFGIAGIAIAGQKKD